jgi:hypothetical protein
VVSIEGCGSSDRSSIPLEGLFILLQDSIFHSQNFKNYF